MVNIYLQYFYICINFGRKGHQYVIHSIFSVYTENPHEEAVKILIVLAEVMWALKRNILYRIINTVKKKKSGYLEGCSLEWDSALGILTGMMGIHHHHPLLILLLLLLVHPIYIPIIPLLPWHYNTMTKEGIDLIIGLLYILLIQALKIIKLASFFFSSLWDSAIVGIWCNGLNTCTIWTSYTVIYCLH